MTQRKREFIVENAKLGAEMWFIDPNFKRKGDVRHSEGSQRKAILLAALPDIGQLSKQIVHNGRIYSFPYTTLSFRTTSEDTPF